MIEKAHKQETHCRKEENKTILLFWFSNPTLQNS